MSNNYNPCSDMIGYVTSTCLLPIGSSLFSCTISSGYMLGSDAQSDKNNRHFDTEDDWICTNHSGGKIINSIWVKTENYVE